ncbi:MAG TPA: GNAT family N-acetyltransferase [Jatrophihabitantaceae bacterium]|nr:GNAT family N-acetyltransferase [Jatrophihabitantaceae bacterium]
MSELEIVNPISADEAAGWLATMVTTFFGDVHEDGFARRVEHRREQWLPERTWGARDGGRWVATLNTQPRTLTVPGPDGGTRVLPADALTGVTVAATHRRRGVLTSMLTGSLTAAKERGDVLSMLVAAEWPIYGRFGYAPATRYADYRYFPRAATAKVTASGRGMVRQVEPAEAGRLGPAIFEAASRRRVGQVDRPPAWWHARFGDNGLPLVRGEKIPTYVLHEGPGGPDGLLAWRPERDFDLIGNLAAIEVSDLITATDDAYRDLWAYVSGIDAVSEVSVPGRGVDEQVRWLLADGRALRKTYDGDHTWLRLLDVPAALGARHYALPGRLVIEVVGDPFGFANGRFALDADGTGSACAPTSEPAELRLSHTALASIYLGGYRLRELAIGGGIEELRPGTIARADLMFTAPQEPWNATGF